MKSLLDPISVSILFLALAPLTAKSARATETDQYFAWGKEIHDSLVPLNRKINSEIQLVLDGINRSDDLSGTTCDDVVGKISSHFRFFIGKDWPELWSEYSSEVDRLPNTEQEKREYDQFGIYGPYEIWDLGLMFGTAPTIRINGVNLGSDKLGHHFVIAGLYYRTYRQAILAGASQEDAEKRAIDLGVSLEKGRLGLATSGVFSYGDLEANYQGMKFYESLCREQDPGLEKTAHGWVLQHPYDGREYINLDFDESLNTSGYTPYRWSRVKKRLIHYCPALHWPSVIALKERYSGEEPRLESVNVSRSYEKELIREGKAPDPAQWSLEKLCAESH